MSPCRSHCISPHPTLSILYCCHDSFSPTHQSPPCLTYLLYPSLSTCFLKFFTVCVCLLLPTSVLSSLKGPPTLSTSPINPSDKLRHSVQTRQLQECGKKKKKRQVLTSGCFEKKGSSARQEEVHLSQRRLLSIDGSFHCLWMEIECTRSKDKERGAEHAGYSAKFSTPSGQ